MANLIATAEIDVAATPAQVWAALTDPAQIKKYFLGAEVETDWRPGSPITWKGEYQGNAYEDKGTIIEFEPDRRLQVTHFSPMSGQPDEPENYHTLTYELEQRGGYTNVVLTQDRNASQAEAEHASTTWAGMLAGLKKTVEGE